MREQAKSKYREYLMKKKVKKKEKMKEIDIKICLKNINKD